MKNKFKAGDKVRCVDNKGAGILELGYIYTVIGVRYTNKPEYVDISGIQGGFFPHRFELVEENKNMKKKYDAIWIKVDNEIVSEFIQKLLFKAGFAWGFRGEQIAQNTSSKCLLASFDTPIWEKKKVYHSGSILPYDFEVFDAVTDLAKIMEILSAKPEMEAPVINNYTMEYKKGNDIVTFGCANISILMLRDVFNAMTKTRVGNRGFDRIVLNSGVTLTEKNIKDILDYVQFVDENG
jgi:hypothetical protein